MPESARGNTFLFCFTIRFPGTSCANQCRPRLPKMWPKRMKSKCFGDLGRHP
ncbi:hypothetical protein PF008_g32122 [Phytophthora fragariae]|uniref:Uncharacterized protein n=1 Tax=Phytophthora fragariae TaxID=53985 RepID=A0A6G0Q0R5_9STRA|nr:hypothetical protein PF008_g32122 [Phytophthora fragariae]